LNISPGEAEVWERAAGYVTRSQTTQNEAREQDSAPAFELFIDSSTTGKQVQLALEALADYYRACGGIGLTIEFERQMAEVGERVDA
jgi:hypothetical protein